MTVNDTIKTALLGYPTLFQSPGDVLHNLFVAIGTGFEWHNGELVNRFGTMREDATAYLSEQIEENRKGERESLVFFYEEMAHRFAFTKANIDRVVEHGERQYTGPLSSLLGQYSPIVELPSNVTDDWLLAAYRFADGCMVGIRMRESTGTATQNDPLHMEVLQGLSKRFDGMLIERGLHSTPEEREALISEILAELQKSTT